MADNANNKELPEGDAPPKKSKLKKFLIFFLVFLIIGAVGGGGAYWWFYMRAPVETTPEAAASAEQGGQDGQTGSASGTEADGEKSPRIERPSVLPRSTGQVLPLPPFVVNLSDAAGKRYLRLGMEVEVNQDVSSLLKSQEAKVRDAVIVLLAGKTFADISTAEGKILLKAEVAARLNQILGGAYVVRVYFTEFVVE